MSVTETHTFEEYLESMRPAIRTQVARQVGVEFKDIERFRHPFLSWDDLEQACHLKLWKVFEQHRDKPWPDLRRIGGKAIKGCVLDQIDRTRVRGQAGASVVSLDAALSPNVSVDAEMEGSFLDESSLDALIDCDTPDIEAEMVEAAEHLGALVSREEQLILRELITMSQRTLELFEAIRRKAPKTRQTDSIRFEAISKSLEVPLARVLRIVPKLLEGLDSIERDTRGKRLLRRRG